MIEGQTLLLFIYILFPCLLAIKVTHKDTGSFWWIYCIIFCVIIANRGENIGSDTRVYRESYESLTFYLSESYEYSWIAICSICSTLNCNFIVVQLIYAVFAIFPVFYVTKKESKYPYLSLLLFVLLGYFFLSFNIMRQMAAVGCGILAFYNLKKNNTYLMILFVFFAYLFHNTALIIFVLVFLYYIFAKLSFKVLVIFLLLSLLFGVFLYSSFDSVALLLGDKYENYASYSDTKDVNFLFVFFINTINTIFCIYFLSKEKKISFYFQLYCLSVFLGNLCGYNIGINRTLYYISIFTIIALSNSFQRVGSVVKLFYIYVVFSYIFSIFKNSSGIYPF